MSIKGKNGKQSKNSAKAKMSKKDMLKLKRISVGVVLLMLIISIGLGLVGVFGVSFYKNGQTLTSKVIKAPQSFNRIVGVV